eukprot:1162140-Pelagomonas_calceolata.AAC.2
MPEGVCRAHARRRSYDSREPISCVALRASTSLERKGKLKHSPSKFISHSDASAQESAVPSVRKRKTLFMCLKKHSIAYALCGTDLSVVGKVMPAPKYSTHGASALPCFPPAVY